MTLFTRKHYKALADWAQRFDDEKLIKELCKLFKADNPRFDEYLFLKRMDPNERK